MEVVILENSEECSAYAARIAASWLKKKPNTVLGLPTGRTPLNFYRQLIRMYQEEGLSFKQAVTFNLDEYVGIGKDHPASYANFMQQNLFRFIDANPENIHIPDGLCHDVELECQSYEEMIKSAGGIDLQFLGIGGNGHIAFNEPGSSFASRTRVKTLTEKTIQDNSPEFGGTENVPMHVMTMGIGSIMEAKQIVLLAFGESKAEVIRQMVEGPLTASVPASILQMHPKATIVIDRQAASKLERSDYYQWVFNNRPDWQRL